MSGNDRLFYHDPALSRRSRAAWDRVEETRDRSDYIAKPPCAALTSIGERCTHVATRQRDGKPVCPPHKRAKSVKWAEEVKR